MVEKGRRPGKRDTRAEIVDAARQAFGQVGYDRASLRAIAASAGVDPALVHHYFPGGKPDLFAESMHLGSDPRHVVDHVDRLVDGGGGGATPTLGQAIVAGFLDMWDSADTESGVPAGSSFVTFVQASSASEAAADAVREFLADRIWSKAAAQQIPAEHRLRSQSLVASQLMGLGFARYVLRLPALVEASAEDLSRWVGPTLDAYLTGPDGPDGPNGPGSRRTT
jgi:AcrR family transcriptional regulator